MTSGGSVSQICRPGRMGWRSGHPVGAGWGQQVELPPDEDLRGVVLRAAGASSWGCGSLTTSACRSLCASVRPSGQLLRHRGVTDAEGRCRFFGLNSDTVRIQASQGEEDTHSSEWRYSEWVEAAAGGPEQRVVLDRDRALPVEGVILGPDGVAVPYLKVEARWTAVRGGVRYAEVEKTFADHEGRFRLKVEPGYSVDLWVNGKRQIVVGADASELTSYRGELPGITPPATDLVFPVHRTESGALTVHVVDPFGAPVPGAIVNVRGQSGKRQKADADGTVHLDELPPELVWVHAAPPATRPSGDPLIPSAAVEIDPDGREVTLALRRGAALEGTVLDREGRPVAKEPVYFSGEDFSIGACTDADGRFCVTVPPGVVGDLRVDYRYLDHASVLTKNVSAGDEVTVRPTDH